MTPIVKIVLNVSLILSLAYAFLAAVQGLYWLAKDVVLSVKSRIKK